MITKIKEIALWIYRWCGEGLCTHSTEVHCQEDQPAPVGQHLSKTPHADKIRPLPASGRRLGWLYRETGDWNLHAGRWRIQNTLRDALQDSRPVVKGPRPETLLKLVNAIPLPNTDLTVIQRSEPEVGLNVDEERIQDHMPRPVKLDGTDEVTKLLRALVHWVMHNNLLTIINKYPAKQASRGF